MSPRPPATGLRWNLGRDPEVFREDPAAVATRLGGWFDASYQDNDRSGSEPSLSVNHLNVFLDTRYRRWQLFAEAEYEHEDDRSGFEGERELELEQGYLRFQAHEWLSTRLGRFNTPFGYWNPVHWEILMDTIEPPLYVGREWIPEQQIGAELSGAGFPGRIGSVETEVRYAAYLGYGAPGLGQEQGDGFSGGADLRLRLDERYLFGASLYRQRNNAARDRTETSFMLYTELELADRWTFRSEYARQRRERPSGALWERDVDAVYAKLRWYFLDQAYLNYRFGYGDDDEDGLTAETLVQTLTLGIQPTPRVRVKLEYSDHQFRVKERDDFNFWGISVGYFF